MGRFSSSRAKAKLRPFAPGGLVRFVEDGQVERLARLQSRADDLRRLVGGEDDFRAGEGSVEKVAHARGIGGDLEVEVRLRRGNRIQSVLHGRVGADAEISESGQARFVQPLMKVWRSSEARGQNPGGGSRRNSQAGRLRYALGDPECDEGLARATRHDGGNTVVGFQRGK